MSDPPPTDSGADLTGLDTEYRVTKDGEVVAGGFMLDPTDDSAARIALLADADATPDDETAERRSPKARCDAVVPFL